MSRAANRPSMAYRVPGSVGVLKADDRRAVVSRGRGDRVATDQHEARGVLGVIFDVGRHDVKSEELAGESRARRPPTARVESATSEAAWDVEVVWTVSNPCSWTNPGPGRARARSCARSSSSSSATPGRARRWRWMGKTISWRITRSWAKTRPSMVAETVPSSAFSMRHQPLIKGGVGDGRRADPR